MNLWNQIYKLSGIEYIFTNCAADLRKESINAA